MNPRLRACRHKARRRGLGTDANRRVTLSLMVEGVCHALYGLGHIASHTRHSMPHGCKSKMAGRMPAPRRSIPARGKCRYAAGRLAPANGTKRPVEHLC